MYLSVGDTALFSTSKLIQFSPVHSTHSTYLTLQEVLLSMNFLHMIICSLCIFTETTALLIFRRNEKTEHSLSVCNVAQKTGNGSNYTCELEFQEPLLLCL
jgi:hypothetical protein